MRKMRAAAPFVVALALVCLGSTLGLMATGGVPETEGIVAHIARFIVGNTIALIGLFIAGVQAAKLWLKQHVYDAVFAHNADEKAHYAASKHNHEPLTLALQENKLLLEAIHGKVHGIAEGLDAAKEELDGQDLRLREMEKTFLMLHTEHEMIHAMQLQRAKGKRRNDPPDFDPESVRGGK